MNKIKKKKTIIFSNPTSLRLSFALGHGIFHGNSCFFLDQTNGHICLLYLYEIKIATFYINQVDKVLMDRLMQLFGVIRKFPIMFCYDR